MKQNKDPFKVGKLNNTTIVDIKIHGYLICSFKKEKTLKEQERQYQIYI